MRQLGWFLLLVLLSASLPGPAQAVSCTSPERCYGSDQTLDGSVTVAQGNVTILSGARLVLHDSDLVIAGSGPRTLTVQPGALLVLDNSRVRSDATPFDVVVQGTLQSLGGRLLGATTLTVHDGGLASFNGGSIDLGDGIATQPSGTLEAVGTLVVTHDADASQVLGGPVTLANVRWNGTGAVQWAGHLVADGLTGRGPSWSCQGATLQASGLDLRAAAGAALSTAGCSGTLARSSLRGPQAWSSQGDGSVVAREVVLNATQGTGLRVAGGGPLLVGASRITAAGVALDARDGAHVILAGVDLSSNGTRSLQCTGADVDATAGTWRSPQPTRLERCAGTLADLQLAARGGALRWDNDPAAGPRRTEPAILRSLSFTNLTGGGDGVPFAFDVRANGGADRLSEGTASLGLARWRAVSAPVTIANVTATSAACALDLWDGAFGVDHAAATAGAKAICAHTASLAVTASNLSAAAVPLSLQATAATLRDVHLAASHDQLDAASSVVSRRGFAPKAVYKNGAPAASATVQVRKLDGTALASSTAGADGLPAAYDVEVLRQNATALTLGPDVLVRVTLGTLANDTRLSLSANPLRVVLRDDTAPTGPAALHRGNSTPDRVVLSWDAATDNHLAPAYEVRLATPAGAPALLPTGAHQAVDVLRTTRDTSTTLALPGQGRYLVNVTAVDDSGNRGPTRGLVAIWDTGRPTLSASAGDAAVHWSSAPVDLQLQAADAESGVASTTVVADGATLAGPRIEASGEHAVQVTVVDYAGNSASANLTVRVDRTPPTPLRVGLVGRDGGLALLAANGSAADAHSGIKEVRVWVTQDGQRHLADTLLPPLPATFAVAVAGRGAADILVETVDVAGNVAAGPTLPLAALPAGVRLDGHGGSPAEAPAPSLGLVSLLLVVVHLVCRTSFKR